MEQTTAYHSLNLFRLEVYSCALGQRKDTMFELMEAALVSSTPATLARLSLAPVFRRRWPAASDALADGSLDRQGCQELVHGQLAQVPIYGRPVWAVDATVWPRPAAITSPERTYGHWASPGIPQSAIIAAWEYQWLVAVPEQLGSWVLPLDVTRRPPNAQSPTQIAISQLRGALSRRPASAPRPVVTLDSSYDPILLARAGLAADLLVRLPRRRRFYRPPPPYSGRGGPRKHGPVFKLPDETTHGQPDQRASGQDTSHGQVWVDVWQGLHDQSAVAVAVTVVRVRVEHRPRSRRSPQPLWLAWIGQRLPDDLLDLWRWYCRRFTVEHGFRFLKQDLGWTTVRPKEPAAADRWSWLMALAMWQLWLARAIVADYRLPWERPLANERLTPGRVRRAFLGLLTCLGTPARAVRPRGKSPGRQPGQCPGPRPRYPVVRRRPKHAA